MCRGDVVETGAWRVPVVHVGNSPYSAPAHVALSWDSWWPNSLIFKKIIQSVVTAENSSAAGNTGCEEEAAAGEDAVGYALLLEGQAPAWGGPRRTLLLGGGHGRGRHWYRRRPQGKRGCAVQGRAGGNNHSGSGSSGLPSRLRRGGNGSGQRAPWGPASAWWHAAQGVMVRAKK